MALVKITIKKQNLAIYVKVEDNGIGMNTERSNQICKSPLHSETGNGFALYNVNRRLTIMYGERSGLQIKSELNKGTEICFFVPMYGGKLNGHIYSNTYC